jgi:hypothetical protein
MVLTCSSSLHVYRYSNVALSEQSTLYHALSEDGVMVAQVGKTDVTRQWTGFPTVQEYSEIHGGVMQPLRYVMASKASTTRWYAHSTEVDLWIADRTVRTHAGDRALHFFDGATMMTYQHPVRVNPHVKSTVHPSSSYVIDHSGLDVLALQELTSDRNNTIVSPWQSSHEKIQEHVLCKLIPLFSSSMMGNLFLNPSDSTIASSPYQEPNTTEGSRSAMQEIQLLDSMADCNEWIHNSSGQAISKDVSVMTSLLTHSLLYATVAM